MWYSSSSGKIELKITKAQAAIGSHSGQCDSDVQYLLTVPAIARQLKKLDPAIVRETIAETGGWSGEELDNHEVNLSRLLWIACGDIQDRT
jgi:hypothetical protein